MGGAWDGAVGLGITRVTFTCTVVLRCRFDTVIWGNEVSKDFRPKGDGDNTLITSDGDAIATADVESYATLLDLPLLGTSEVTVNHFPSSPRACTHHVQALTLRSISFFLFFQYS